MVTIQVIPYAEIASLTSVGRIRKILNGAKDNKIVMLQGRLRKEEEAELIQATMEEINRDFKGIELAVIDTFSAAGASGLEKFKNDMFNLLLGDRQGLTIVGPASIVKQIKKNPKKVELLLSGKRSVKKRTAKKKTRRRR